MVMERAIEIRGTSLITGPKIKLPDAIIGATAATYRMPIVTRNPKDFQWEGIDLHVPYNYDSTTGAVRNVRPTFTPRSGPGRRLLASGRQPQKALAKQDFHGVFFQ